jgi:hypothetical protein
VEPTRSQNATVIWRCSASAGGTGVRPAASMPPATGCPHALQNRSVAASAPPQPSQRGRKPAPHCAQNSAPSRTGARQTGQGMRPPNGLCSFYPLGIGCVNTREWPIGERNLRRAPGLEGARPRSRGVWKEKIPWVARESPVSRSPVWSPSCSRPRAQMRVDARGPRGWALPRAARPNAA